jgi:hypothetical protein
MKAPPVPITTADAAPAGVALPPASALQLPCGLTLGQAVCLVVHQAAHLTNPCVVHHLCICAGPAGHLPLSHLILERVRLVSPTPLGPPQPPTAAAAAAATVQASAMEDTNAAAGSGLAADTTGAAAAEGGQYVMYWMQVRQCLSSHREERAGQGAVYPCTLWQPPAHVDDDARWTSHVSVSHLAITTNAEQSRPPGRHVKAHWLRHAGNVLYAAAEPVPIPTVLLMCLSTDCCSCL